MVACPAVLRLQAGLSALPRDAGSIAAGPVKAWPGALTDVDTVTGGGPVRVCQCADSKPLCSVGTDAYSASLCTDLDAAAPLLLLLLQPRPLQHLHTQLELQGRYGSR
jgi:hypothetical protein